MTGAVGAWSQAGGGGRHLSGVVGCCVVRQHLLRAVVVPRPRRLPESQVEHNLLRAASDGCDAHLAVEPLHERPLPLAAEVGRPAEDLRRLARAALEAARRLHLVERRVARVLRVPRLVHPPREPHRPFVRGSHLSRHLRALVPNRLHLEERLAKGAARARVRERRLEAEPRKAHAKDADRPPLVVEILQDELKPAVLAADEVGRGDAHVVKDDERRV
mmetsp:Transcript_8348/g.27749  ORF Transcript_8348/g.27749 Transcript_8348/m.27749 type:complete len:218 (+) Transcript_8348:17-670(+)